MSHLGTCAVVALESDQRREALRLPECGRFFEHVFEAHAPGDLAGAQWVFYVGPFEQPTPDALTLAAPSLGIVDALFGGCLVEDTAGNNAARSIVPKRAKIAAGDRVTFAHAALNWWIGPSHLRRATSDNVTEAGAFAAPISAKDTVRLWRTGRVLKTAQPLTATRHALLLGEGQREGLPPGPTGLAAVVIDDLDCDPAWMTVSSAGVSAEVPYTGRNPTIERVQTRGGFFEAGELTYVRDLLAENGSKGVGLDVGANTGNHTAFLARGTALTRIIALEPNGITGTWLSRTCQRNALSSVDLGLLGTAVGDTTGRARIDVGRRGHLGTARLVADAEGPVAIRPLDDLVEGPVDFIKIDVEDTEIAVLSGARRILAESDPILLIEVQDHNITAFLGIVMELGYRIVQVFPDEGYANYVLRREGT